MNRFLAFCLLVIVLLGVAAFWMHWINVSREVKPDGSTGVAVTLDRDKVQQDLDAVKQAARDVGEGVKTGAARFSNPGTMTGVVTQVDPAGRRVTITNQDRKVELHVNEQTTIRIGDREAHLSDLSAGETVKAAYTGTEPDTIARSIDVVEKR